MQQHLRFSIEKETKNTVRYQEETGGKPPVIGTLYVQKWALGMEIPSILSITISTDPPA